MERLISLITATFLLTLPMASCEDFFETDISSQDVVLLAPADNAQLVTGEIDFVWEKLSTDAVYELRIVSPSFDKPERQLCDDIIEADSLLSTVSYQTSLVAGKYQWRVRAFNSTSETTSDTRNVIISEPISDEEQP